MGGGFFSISQSNELPHRQWEVWTDERNDGWMEGPIEGLILLHGKETISRYLFYKMKRMRAFGAPSASRNLKCNRLVQE